MEKVYITSRQMATFTCPKCQRSKTVNVSQYANIDKTVKVNVKCPCGHAYTTILEKRRQYRKETNLPGTYVHHVAGKAVHRGRMMVENISTTGLKIRLDFEQKCSIGDVLAVEFHLDDVHQTLIKKNVIVRNINGPHIGTEFAPTETVGKALGFYLFT